jgi:hypothetical protein
MVRIAALLSFFSLCTVYCVAGVEILLGIVLFEFDCFGGLLRILLLYPHLSFSFSFFYQQGEQLKQQEPQ